MNHFVSKHPFLLISVAAFLGLSLITVGWVQAKNEAPAEQSQAKATLSVNVVTPQLQGMAVRINANGTITAWQEAVVGTQTNGLRLSEVLVNVGDVVKKGQRLATFDQGTVQADLAQIRANLAEAQATWSDAKANAQRARSLQNTGALSAQQINQFVTAEQTAAARVQALKASAHAQALRLAQTNVLAPDFGAISARSATVGAVLPAGQELFRLIVKNRLEWRGEVAANAISRIKPGQVVHLTTAADTELEGTVRKVSPTLDAKTRNGLVYVDLPNAQNTPAGMFARGDFELGKTQAMALPQAAVLLRDGFSYVFVVGDKGKVAETKVQVGRRVGDQVEITQGLDPRARVVASGGAFLADGDTVKVVESAGASASASTK